MARQYQPDDPSQDPPSGSQGPHCVPGSQPPEATPLVADQHSPPRVTCQIKALLHPRFDVVLCLVQRFFKELCVKKNYYAGFNLFLTWPAALVPGVVGATVVVGAAVVVTSQVLAQEPLQQVRPVSHRPT